MTKSLEEQLGAKYPEKMEQIAEEIGEFGWDRAHRCAIPEGEDGHVWVDEIEMINAANHQVTGVFWLGGVEYGFRAQMGDRNGFEFLEISADGDIPDIKISRPRFALAPHQELVAKAIQEGKGSLLVARWDAMVARNYPSLMRKYHYDRLFAPGEKTERHYREKAAEGDLQIVSEDEAKTVRERLAEASGPVPDFPEL